MFLIVLGFGDARGQTYQFLRVHKEWCWQLFWNELFFFVEKFWNFIRLWRQRRWFAAWKYEILTFTDRCCSDVTRSKEIFKRRLCSSTCVFKLCGMSKYFLPGMKDFSGGSDISARLFRNILNMKSQNQQNTSIKLQTEILYWCL